MNLNSIRTKLGVLFLSFALLVITSAGATFWSLDTQKQDALVINLAGRQRMLIQQMQREVLQIATGKENADRSKLIEARQTFDQTLHAFQYGGDAPYLPDRQVRLPGATDAAVRAQILELRANWDHFSESIEIILNEAPGSPAFEDAEDNIQRLSPGLAEQADTIVRQYEALSNQKIIRLRWIQSLFLVIVFLLLGLGSWITTRTMIEPLRSLGNTASRIGTGDLSAPVDVRGASEINLLSQAMEAMRQELEISRDELVQSAELLEQRVDQRTKELEALNQVSREIASRLELPQVLQSVAAKTIQLLGAEAVFLCLLDENGAQMRLQATLGPDGSIQASSTSAQAPPARSVLDSEAALSCGAGDCRGGCQIINPLYRNSHLVAPLKTGQHILGALCVGSRKLEAFTADSEALLFRLANIAAIAIENARLYAQAERAASLEERQCIAAEIHDGLAQTLSFLKLMAGQIALEVETGRIPEALNNLTRLDQALNLAVDDTRRAITSLQEHGPLREVLQDQISQLVEDFSSQYATSVEWLNAPTAPIVLSHQDNEQVLRIVQEALNNARQHSQATRIAICLDACGQDHIITVQDNGKGFDPEDIPLTNGRVHFGLKIMQARAARIGGSLEIRSEPGAGTEVRLTWPKMK